MLQCGTSLALASGSTPSVNYVVRVVTPASSPEAYSTPNGLVQWHTGLPIPVADSIAVTAAVVGDASITQLDGKFDGRDLAPVISAPWTETIASPDLSLGVHSLDITAQIGKKGAKAVLTLNFTVVQSLPAELAPPLITSVKGAQQLLSQGKVATLDPVAANVLPPVVGAMAQETSDPGAGISFSNGIADDECKAGQTVIVNGSLTAMITPSSGSTDKAFVYSVYRDGSNVASSSALTPLTNAKIKIQAGSDGVSGLYPGLVQLYVWGVDQSGNFSAPAVVSLDITNDDSPVLTKP